MAWQWSIWSILELAATVSMIVLTFYSSRIIPARVRNLGLLLLTCGTLYMFSHALEIGMVLPAHKYLFYQSQTVILAITATVWLAFILQYIHEDYRFSPRTIVLLCIMPVVVTFLVITNGIHHLLWAGTFLPSDNPFMFIYGVKPLFWILVASIMAVFIYGVFLLGRHMRLMAEPIRGDAFSILVAAIVVLIFAVFTIARVERTTPYPVSSLAWGLVIAFIVIVLGFRYLRTTHIRPIAEQTALESISDALIAVDKKNRVFYMNPAGERLTGLSLTNAYQQPIRKLLPPWRQLILDFFQEPSSLVKEISVENKGKYYWYEISLSPIKDAVGHLMGRVMLIHDITDRVKSEDERRDIERKAHLASRLSTVGQMAAGICHEINNPLTTIIGYSDLLTNKNLPENMKKEMGYIREAGRRVADIVRQLLVFARNMRPTRAMVDINYIVNGTLKLREYQLRVANINVLTELAPDLPYTFADPGQIQQVFLNIVLNAETEMKSAHGQGTLLVKTERVDDTVKISFKDDGPGISEENLTSIFDPFFTTRKIGEGTGLGLSVCHGIITEHKGRIYAKSTQNKGATFIVELPVLYEPAPEEIPSEAPQEIQQTVINPGSILIVDDDILLLKFLEEFLITKGHHVVAVTNAHDARKAFMDKKYDLILMDILMPEESGIELYKKFQRMDKSVDSRLLIMTGDILGKATTTFLHRAGLPYIEKPFDTDALTTKIDEIISRNQHPTVAKPAKLPTMNSEQD